MNCGLLPSRKIYANYAKGAMRPVGMRRREGRGMAQASQALLKSKYFEFAGALAAQLVVSHEFVPAIDAPLGRNLHALILRDGARAAEIISYLNQQQLGQAALVLERIAHRD